MTSSSSVKPRSVTDWLAITVRNVSWLKIVSALACFVYVAAIGEVTSEVLIYLLHVLAFAGSGFFLITGSNRDRRVANLGIVFLLAATAFSEPLLLRMPAGLSETWVRILLQLEPTAFLPYFFALFFSEFPRRNPRPVWIVQLCLIASLILGAVNTLPIVWPDATSVRWIRIVLEPDTTESFYFWMIVMLLLLPSATDAVWKSRKAPNVERRRAKLFIWSFASSLAPIAIVLIAQTSIPAVRRLLQDPLNHRIAGLLIYTGLLSIPFSTAYAVMVHHVLDVRIIVRKVIQYTLARYSVMTMALSPMVVLAIYGYRHRSEPLGNLIAGWRGVLVVAAMILGVLATNNRSRLLAFIDRRFFREEYDASVLLASLTSSIQRIDNADHLAEVIKKELDSALHLTRVEVLLRDASGMNFVSAKNLAPPLMISSSLVQLAEIEPGPLNVDPDDKYSLYYRLSDDEQTWVRATGCRLLIPIAARTGRILGVIALGAKRSELPFTPDDQRLLATIASSCGLVLNLDEESARDEKNDSGDTASCCDRCRRVYPMPEQECPVCKRKTTSINIPYRLFGKFQLERRLGAGGMGVVYQARDLSLARSVAVKTLPSMSVDHALRLRQEARSIAAVTHPNLAVIHAVENWHGIPLLVFEYLVEGTLADRLRSSGAIGVQEALRLGIQLSDALQHVHNVGILHRDIKPSNIGYARNRVPKLLDFGLAKLSTQAISNVARSRPPLSSNDTTQPVSTDPLSGSQYLAGTPAYLSPEAISGEDPDVQRDLWALTVTLYEAISGRNPFDRGNITETIRAVRSGHVVGLRQARPDCPESVATFFAVALSSDRRLRPTDARELKRALERLTERS